MQCCSRASHDKRGQDEKIGQVLGLDCDDEKGDHSIGVFLSKGVRDCHDEGVKKFEGTEDIAGQALDKSQ